MSEGNQTGWQAIGAHRFRVDPPDTICFSLRGGISASDVLAIYAELHRCWVGNGGKLIFGIADLSRVGTLLPEARKAVLAPAHRHDSYVPIIVGATFALRVSVNLVSRAYRMLSGDPDPIPTLFFETQGEARAWIAENRLASLARWRPGPLGASGPGRAAGEVTAEDAPSPRAQASSAAGSHR